MGSWMNCHFCQMEIWNLSPICLSARCSYSSALAMELLQSCIKPSISPLFSAISPATHLSVIVIYVGCRSIYIHILLKLVAPAVTHLDECRGSVSAPFDHPSSNAKVSSLCYFANIDGLVQDCSRYCSFELSHRCGIQIQPPLPVSS